RVAGHVRVLVLPLRVRDPQLGRARLLRLPDARVLDRAGVRQPALRRSVDVPVHAHDPRDRRRALERRLAHAVRRMSGPLDSERGDRPDEPDDDLMRPGERREDPSAHYPFESARLAHSVSDLRRYRPRSKLVRVSLVGMVALVADSWPSGGISLDDM